MAHRSPSLFALTLLLALGAQALAQFDTPGSTNIRERIVGDLIGGSSDLQPEQGDQIGAFFDDSIIGLFSYDDNLPGFSITLFGDNPMTEVVEGPDRNQRVEFRYFDVSTNQTLNLDVLNAEGEVVNFTYRGIEVLDVPGLPIDLTPTRQFNVRPAGATGGDGGGGGGGGGGGAPGGSGPDVNGDGSVSVQDAAIVLRVIGGAARPGSRAFEDLGVILSDPIDSARSADAGDKIVLTASELVARCDVNGDGAVSTADAIAVLRARRPVPSAPDTTPGDDDAPGSGS